MGLTQNTSDEIRKHLPGRILSLGWPDQMHGNIDLTGSTLTVVDLFRHVGPEIIADLSLPCDLGKYDLVIDCGTLEHVANISQGFINAATSVKIGGHILHEIPMNEINHGYWNISPIWLKDFYTQNGFVIERMDRTTAGTFYESKMLPWPSSDPTENYFVVPEPSLTLCVARRTNDSPVKLPQCQQMWIK